MANYALIVEDHPLYREGLGDTLSSILTDTVVLKAANAEQGLLITDHLHNVRLICLDLGLPKLNGFEAIATFRRKFSQAVIFVVSGADGENLQQQAEKCGANAFISKSVSSTEIISQVYQAMARQAWSLQQEPAANDAECISGQLTSRQAEVLRLLDMGLSNKQIAKQLDVAEVTVKLHVSSIFRVFGVNSRTKALLIARQAGLLPDA